MRRIAINEALGRLKEKNQVYHFRTSDAESENSRIFEIPDNIQLNPQEKMIGNESKRLLENAIDQLDVKYKSVYMMKEVEELSAKEVAEALGITVSNVKIRVHRAKQMLKDNLYQLSNDTNVFEFGFGKCNRVTEFVMKNI